jgi:hypothetical protein
MNYITTLTSGSGIGSVVIGIVRALTHMKKNNITDILYVNLKEASSTGNILFTCFLNLEKLKFIKVINEPVKVILISENKYQVITPGDYCELWYTNTVSVDKNDLQLMYDVFESFWILKDDVYNYLNIHTQQYNADLCINIRRGDKITLEPHVKQGTIEEYVEKIEELENIKTFFHTSDDYSTFLEFKTARPEWNIQTFCTPNDTGYFLKDLNESVVPQNNVDHVRKFLKELEIMKKSEWFVGTRTTNVGLMVNLMRKGENIIFVY